MRLIRHLTFILLLLSASTASAAQFYVSTTGNDANSCTSTGDACLTIQAAIDKAANSDDIIIGAGTFDGGITLNNKGLYILGAGAGQTIVDGSNSSTLFTMSSSINGGSTPSINFFDLTLQNGAGTQGAAMNITCSSMVNGSINVNITEVVFTENNSTSSGGAIFMNDCTSSALSIQRSSFDNNESPSTAGAIYLKGTSAGNSSLSLENVTLYQNSSAMGGSAIYLDDFADFLIGYTTISSNISTGPTPLSSTVHLNVNTGSGFIANTIIANNTGNNCPTPMSPAGSITSQGYNISSDATCTFFNESTDLNSSDPVLGTFSYGSYAIPTVSLDAGSPAIDATSLTCPSTDARGVTRPQGSACDIGAYEANIGTLESSPTSLLFTTTGSTEVVTLSFTGVVPVNIGAASISGADSASFNFAVDNCSNTDFNGASTCSISITFSGINPGSYSAMLTVPNDGTQANLQIPLSASLTGQLAADPSAVNFEGKSKDRITVSLQSGPAVSITGSSLVGPNSDLFGILADSCQGQTLSNPGDSCQVDVQFEGSTAGDYTATLEILDGSLTLLQVALTGSSGGGSPILDLSITGPSSDLSVGDPANYEVMIGNSGDGDAENTVLELIFPSNLELQSVSGVEGSNNEGDENQNLFQASASLPEQCSFSNQTLTCSLETIDAGTQATLHISALITGEGSLAISGSLNSGDQTVSASGGSGTATAGGGLQGACGLNEGASKSHSLFLFLVFTLILLLGCRKKTKEPGIFY